jgi:hemolysin activation/secretion protein
VLLLGAAPCAPAQTPPDPSPEQRRLIEREREQQERLQRTPDVRLPEAAAARQRLPVDEAPCFPIKTTSLRGDLHERFEWLLASLAGPAGDDSAVGKCLGAQGINLLLTRAQDALVARGFVTSRVLAEPQDLKSGQLVLTFVPGRVRSVRFAPGAEGSEARHATTLWNAFAGQSGDVLNLRDLEQTLENFKRVPTAEADFKIEPAGGAPGYSDVVMSYTQARPVRIAASLDDAGTKGTGRYQGSTTLSFDNPTTLNDLFYVTFNHDLAGVVPDDRGTRGHTAHYSLPWDYWLLAATVSRSRYHQTVDGATQDYLYSGSSATAELKLSRLVYRDASRKTTLSLKGFSRRSNNFIDDAEVEVQRRRVGGWEAGFNHREFVGSAVFDGTLAYKRGTGAFGSLRAPEEAFGEGTSRPGIVSADVTITAPFQVGDLALRYSGGWRSQWNRAPLTPQDRLAIGGRYSVRGFDGESSLAGERGWTLRNELASALGQSGSELYVGVDAGRVGGPSVARLAGRGLAGAVIGLRGSVRAVQFDLFAGTAVHRPEGFGNSRAALGFSLNASY